MIKKQDRSTSFSIVLFHEVMINNVYHEVMIYNEKEALFVVTLP